MKRASSKSFQFPMTFMENKQQDGEVGNSAGQQQRFKRRKQYASLSKTYANSKTEFKSQQFLNRMQAHSEYMEAAITRGDAISGSEHDKMDSKWFNWPKYTGSVGPKGSENPLPASVTGPEGTAVVNGIDLATHCKYI